MTLLRSRGQRLSLPVPLVGAGRSLPRVVGRPGYVMRSRDRGRTEMAFAEFEFDEAGRVRRACFAQGTHGRDDGLHEERSEGFLSACLAWLDGALHRGGAR